MESNVQSQARPLSVAWNASASMYSRWLRRLVPSLTVVVGWLILRSIRNRSAASLQNEAFVTGYSLASICVLLMLLGVRKRVLSPQIGRLAVWQQTHHYLGLLSVGVYALHANLITTGWMESALALSFWSIALTGIIGWYVNRTAPRLLRSAGAQILRHDIPERSRLIAKQAHELALASAGKNDTAAMADHYRVHVCSYFTTRRHLLYRISPTGTKRREEGRSQRREMSLLVQAKDDLDFQAAIQNRVRFWASAHTWVLGAFIVLAITHVILAHRFTSSW